MATSVRQRAPAAGGKLSSNGQHDDRDPQNKSKSPKLMNEYLILLVFILHAALYAFIDYRSYSFPEAKTVANHKPGDFVEERARDYLLAITALGDGTRPVGSPENEVLAVQYLMKELNKIKTAAKHSHQIDVDLQTTTGSFTLKFLGEFSSYYENMNNILVKLSPRGNTANDSLLVNCHYDSVVDSPGSSDDTVSCCLMLEVLHVLSQSDEPLKHNVIFLFNGAEENVLQASHGFITQHSWAKDIKAFINLEGAGAGGREIVFQTGPNNPWLIKTYAAVAKHPFASIIGQEVFESGLIPSDTDFRIFRDYGNIPGIDIAYMHNGYVYHTKHDNPQMIPAGCIQRGGDNLLEMVKAFASSPLLSDPGEERLGRMVFYDVIGYFMVLYPARIGYILNNAILVIVILGIAKKVMGKNDRGTAMPSGGAYVKQLASAVALLVASWLLTVLCLSGLGAFMDYINHPEAWFNHRVVLIGLYVIPAIFIQVAFHTFLKNTVYKTQGDMWLVERLFFDAHMLLLSILLAYLTHRGVGSACVILIYVMLPLLIRDRLAHLLRVKFKDNHSLFMVLHLTSLIIPSLLFLYMVYGALEMFIPVMGRIGPVFIPDLFIAVVIAISVIMCMGYQVGIIYVTKSTRRLLFLLASAAILTYILAIFSPLGFPYSGDPVHPRKQRHILHHSDRVFHDISGNVTKSDSQILILPFDRYSMTPVYPHVPQLRQAKLEECDGVYCGWPYYLPMQTLIRHIYTIPAPRLQVSVRPKIEKLERQELSSGVQRLTFYITGPNHINLYLSPRRGVSFEKWSVGNGVPHTTLMSKDVTSDNYFVYYSYGTAPSEPWKFWIEFKVDRSVHLGEGVMDMAVGGHYLFGDDRQTPEMSRLIDSFPDWTYPVGWTATYEAWVF